jgi:arylsulfatase A-like enzyme
VGLLLGLFEGSVGARWDVVMDDASRAGQGLAALAACVAAETAALALLSGLVRRRLACIVWLAAVLGARAWVGDRFDARCLAPAAVAVAAVLVRSARIDGVVAVALGMVSLWGRAPQYSYDLVERMGFWAPAAAGVLLGALPAPRFGLPAALLTSAAAAVVPGLLATPRGTPEKGAPNVLFVLVDTLRQDHVGGWRTDGVDDVAARLAREGTRFADAVTVIPKTTQSVAAMQTGRYPIHNGVRVLHDDLPRRNRTLAEILRARGYRTAAFVHNGWIMRGRGFEQGFSQFWSWWEIERPYGASRYTGVITALDAVTAHQLQPFDGNVDAKEATDRAMAWMGQGDRPFFAYMHYFDPHWPYRPPGADASCMVNEVRERGLSRGRMIFQNDFPEAENARARELYRGEVDYTESQIARLIDWLDTAGLAEDTLVVFTADHGHHLGDHGYYYHHGEFLYEPGVRIPLIMRWPGHVDAGRVVTEQVRSIDILPTLLGRLGVAPEEIDGVDVLADAAFAQEAFLETDISYFRSNKRRYVGGVKGKVRGLRTPDWKLVYTPREGEALWELFDLHADPAEEHDLFAEGRADAATALDLMGRFAAYLPESEKAKLEKLGNRFDQLPSGNAPATDGGAEMGEQMSGDDMAVLRSLGYVE